MCIRDSPIGDSDGQVVILQLKEIDDETEEYVGVENEFVLETVFAPVSYTHLDVYKRQEKNPKTTI